MFLKFLIILELSMYNYFRFKILLVLEVFSKKTIAQAHSGAHSGTETRNLQLQS